VPDDALKSHSIDLPIQKLLFPVGEERRTCLRLRDTRTKATRE
jgi:hypothetical protein